MAGVPDRSALRGAGVPDSGTSVLAVLAVWVFMDGPAALGVALL